MEKFWDMGSSSNWGLIIVLGQEGNGDNLAGVILEGDLGEKVSLSWLTSPYLELREKWKCIECTMYKEMQNLDQNFSQKILKLLQNFSLSESSRMTPDLGKSFWSSI